MAPASSKEPACGTDSTRVNPLAKAARGALEVVLETLWPTRCAVCDLPGESVLCKECERALIPVDACQACPTCGAPYGLVQCTECNDVMLGANGMEKLPVDSMAHALLLDDAARRIVSIYKDADERRLCGIMARIMSNHVSPDLKRLGFVITYIPDTAEARRRRGFDHSEEMAEELSGRCGLPIQRLLKRPKSADQRKLGRRGRIENMAGRMSARDDAEMPRRVLLVDDVCTTGATIYSAAKALKEAGVEEVRALTLGKVLD